MEKDIFPDTSFLGVPRAKTMHDLFKAEVKIVPGIRSIEVLPEHLRDDPSYHFSGPLLMEDLLISGFDYEVESATSKGVNYFRRFDLLESFFKQNEGRRIIYATFGTIAKAGREVIECLKYLLENDTAVVSNIYLEGVSEKDQSLHFFAQYLPMHFVCSKSDLVIHHSGSGAYHYPIINQTPSLTIGTQCYDRDDVAVRLEELGVSMHLPAPAEDSDFVASFKEKMEQYFANSGALLNEKRKNLIPLKEEIDRTIEAFDLEAAFEQAISSYKPIRSGKSIRAVAGGAIKSELVS
jgi:hypothetical protein